MQKITPNDIARMIDISAVRADSTLEEVNTIIEKAILYNFICIFPMPCFIPVSIKKLVGHHSVSVGGVVGFPSGGETTNSKVFQACENVRMGCKEIDMVINIGKLKSGLYEDVLEDICAVKDAIGDDIPLKVIIEVALLTDVEIEQAANIVRRSGADFLKTGTGWAGVTTLSHVKQIKNIVGDTIKIKVAGGVRDLDTLLEMHNVGVCRFGIGHKAASEIIEEAKMRYGK